MGKETKWGTLASPLTMSTRRRYQTLPNIKYLRRKKPQQDHDSSSNYFEGLFGGSNFLTRYNARSRERLHYECDGGFRCRQEGMLSLGSFSPEGGDPSEDFYESLHFDESPARVVGRRGDRSPLGHPSSGRVEGRRARKRPGTGSGQLSLPPPQAERLSEYEQYFASLLVDTHPDHPDYADVSRNHQRVAQLVSRQEDDFGELERIQELFPNDNLKLYEKDPVAQKMKGLIRKRSTTAARLQRAFSAKGLRAEPHNNNNNDLVATPHRQKDPKPKRQFIMETPVHFTTGMQSQERHLFLFTDLLLVAKARSGGNFKLKEKVRVSEMWLGGALDDVAEVPRNAEASFVVGWPTTNVVASFSCVATKDLWFNKLSQAIAEERDKEPPSTTIQITYYDPINNTDICKTVSISSTTTARECISLVLAHLELPSVDEEKFQLWVKSANEESPYPLIGHELPFAVRMNCLRDLLQECDTEQCAHLCTTDVIGRCQFILRQERKLPQSLISSPEGGKKPSKKAKKSPMRIHKVFRRSNSKGDITDGAPHVPPGVLFAQPLHKICDAAGNTPKPILDLLHQLLQKGPFTVGIFRKSANARLVRELKEKLDGGEEIPDLENIHIMAIAALFKDFLRSLPDCLLCTDLYEEWLELPRLPTVRERISKTLLLCSRLPRPHLTLLQRFLCVLHHIAKRANENMMSASNLAVCVGPSLLWPPSPILALSPEASKQAPATVEFLIERCASVFGKNLLSLMGDPPETDPLRQDSGAEESDSLHSSGGMRRDDSSIDSLERELIGEGELSPLPRKDKMSLTNLSRDSGLTMSDSQLYTPDEEESGSTSSSQSGGEKGFPQDRFQHYSAPNDPNAIYTAVFRRPEKTFDEPDNYYAAPHHTRVRVAYSSPPEEVIYSVPSQCGSNFQRHDWTRRCSRPRMPGEGLARSASEESLNKFNTLEFGLSLGAAGNTGDDYDNRGRLPTPEQDHYSTIGGRDSPLRRSKSAHQIDEECEPTVRRSPERVGGRPVLRKDAVKWRSTPQIHDEGDRSYDSSTLSDDDSTPHVSRSNSRGKDWDSNSSYKSESVCTVVSLGSVGSNPPSYEEALSRRALSRLPDGAIREEKRKSAKAKQLYEESLRIYQEENPCDLVRASPAHAHDDTEPPPLPPKCEPPPLPPKQRAGGRLKQLPPVHVETPGRRARSVVSLPATQLVFDPPVHKTIICTADPPMLPPKERTVIEVEAAPRKKSIETQTDDCDLDDDWVTSVAVPDVGRRPRARRRESGVSGRSRSMPGREEEDEEEWLQAELQQEISWSVAQLRAIFGDSLKGAKVHPPPYRPPPRAPGHQYHLSDVYRKQSNYAEESYV